MSLSLSAGLLIGIGLSETGFSMVYGVIARDIPAAQRSSALGIAAAAGSFGQFAMLPAVQVSISALGWFASLLLLAVAAGLMAPLGRALVRTQELPARSRRAKRSPKQDHTRILAACVRLFVCGLQIVFIATHLPA